MRDSNDRRTDGQNLGFDRLSVDRLNHAFIVRSLSVANDKVFPAPHSQGKGDMARIVARDFKKSVIRTCRKKKSRHFAPPSNKMISQIETGYIKITYPVIIYFIIYQKHFFVKNFDEILQFFCKKYSKIFFTLHFYERKAPRTSPFHALRRLFQIRTW